MTEQQRRIASLAAAILVSLLLGQSSRAEIDRQTIKWLSRSPVIDSITVDGAVAFSRGRVLEQLYSKRTSFLRALRSERRSRIQRETLNRDTLEVKFLYLTNGYLGVHVTEDFQPLLPDSTALVRLSIREGRQFRYGPVTVKGELDRRDSIRFGHFARQLHRGKPVNPFEMQSLALRLREELANHGYPYATITVFPDTLADQLLSPVTITIARDSIVHFGGIEIDGVSNFPRHSVERELRMKTGELYRRDNILTSQRLLYATGNFSGVLIEPVASSPRYQPVMGVRVRERKPFLLSFKTGAGQSQFRALQWDFEGQFGQRNFFGYRRYDLTARSSLGFGPGEKARLLKHQYILRYTEPRPFNIRLPLSTALTWEPSLADEVLDIRVESWKLTVETRRRNLGRWSWGIGAEYIWTNLSDLNLVDTTHPPGTERQQRRKGFVELRYEGRDNIFVPVHGLYFDGKLEQFGGPFGGQGNFIRGEGSLAAYTPVSGGLISASRLHYGIARAAANNTISFLDQALFTGGANSVRGFRDNRLGPLDANGDPVGARYVLVANQEFRWETFQLLKYLPLIGSYLRPFPLWQSAFVDFGNGFASAKEIRLDNFAVSIGTGVQLLTPAGPLRLDYARVLPTKHFGSQERFHFTILYAF